MIPPKLFAPSARRRPRRVLPPVLNADAGDEAMIPPTINYDTDPMDRAGLGARGKRGEVNDAGRAFASGNVAPGGPALNPKYHDEDEEEGERSWGPGERTNADTYRDEDSDMAPPRMEFGNRDSKPLSPIGRTFADVLLEQEQQAAEAQRRMAQP